MQSGQTIRPGLKAFAWMLATELPARPYIASAATVATPSSDGQMMPPCGPAERLPKIFTQLVSIPSAGSQYRVRLNHELRTFTNFQKFGP